jgi:hypothetical protein
MTDAFAVKCTLNDGVLAKGFAKPVVCAESR